MANEKSMRKPEDDESPVEKQEDDFSNNLERGKKPNKGNLQLSSEQYDPDSDPSKNTLTEGFHSKNEEIPSGRPQFQGEINSVPQQKEKKDMLLNEHKGMNGITQDCAPSKRIPSHEEAAKTSYTAPKNTPLPFYRPGTDENTSTFPNVNMNSSKKERLVQLEDAAPYVAEKNVGVPKIPCACAPNWCCPCCTIL